MGTNLLSSLDDAKGLLTKHIDGLVAADQGPLELLMAGADGHPAVHPPHAEMQKEIESSVRGYAEEAYPDSSSPLHGLPLTQPWLRALGEADLELRRSYEGLRTIIDFCGMCVDLDHSGSGRPRTPSSGKVLLNCVRLVELIDIANAFASKFILAGVNDIDRIARDVAEKSEAARTAPSNSRTALDWLRRTLSSYVEDGHRHVAAVATTRDVVGLLAPVRESVLGMRLAFDLMNPAALAHDLAGCAKDAGDIFKRARPAELAASKLADLLRGPDAPEGAA